MEASLSSDLTGAAVVHRSSISEPAPPMLPLPSLPLPSLALSRLLRKSSGIRPPSGRCSSANGALAMANTLIFAVAAAGAASTAGGSAAVGSSSRGAGGASCALSSARPRCAALYLGHPSIWALRSACRQSEPAFSRSLGRVENNPLAKLDTSANRRCDGSQL
jgi:hypothetical protein